MNENEFILEDRIAKIQSINEQYDLLNNSYISFSGGKDSVVLSKLIDLALPNNKIPRLYANTGIEYNLMVKYVIRERERERFTNHYCKPKSKHKAYFRNIRISI